MITQEQIEKRKRHIGGSDVAKVLGLSQWATPFEVWQDKQGITPPFEGNPLTALGHALEPTIIAQCIADHEGLHSRQIKSELSITSDEYPALIAHPDCIVGDTVIEAKYARDYSHRSWNGEPPIDYQLQLLHYMYMCNCSDGILAVMTSSGTMHYYYYSQMPEGYEPIASQLQQWWDTYITANVAPPNTVKATATAVEGTSVTTDDSITRAITQYAEINSSIAELTQIKEQLREQILSHMGSATLLLSPAGRIIATCNEVTTSRVDTKALPLDIVQEYSKKTTTRVLRLTKATS